MPLVMLKRDWPGTFRRTVQIGKKAQLLTFSPGVAVELDARTIEAIKADIGIALLPCEYDEKAKVRVITDDVVTESEAEFNGQNAE